MWPVRQLLFLETYQTMPMQLWFRIGWFPAASPAACLQPLLTEVPLPPDLTHAAKPAATQSHDMKLQDILPEGEEHAC